MGLWLCIGPGSTVATHQGCSFLPGPVLLLQETWDS